MKVCFGIISIGKSYTEEFERLFKPSVLAYCNKHGYDLKVFNTFLDPNQKHPDTISFQKCLVPSFLTEYDLVVILDADIYIESYAPPIHELKLNDKIGIVNEIGQSTSQQYEHLNKLGFADYANSYYLKVDLELDTEYILNTGVIVCNPELHCDFLKSVYEKYVNKSIGHSRGFHYEQGCIGYELQKNNMFTLIPNTWNFIYVHSQLLGITSKNNYFVHFAGLRSSQREIALSTHTSKSFIRWGIKK